MYRRENCKKYQQLIALPNRKHLQLRERGKEISNRKHAQPQNKTTVPKGHHLKLEERRQELHREEALPQTMKMRQTIPPIRCNRTIPPRRCTRTIPPRGCIRTIPRDRQSNSRINQKN